MNNVQLFKVLMVAAMKVVVLRDVNLSNLADVYQHFGATYFLRHKDRLVL
jgi:hypothetical protein